MNVTMEYSEAIDLYNILGIDGLMNFFEERYNFKFFYISTAWIDSNNYICKLKGERGDLIIIWE
ncbi:hypothetical protein M3649_03960 [Ureibacillus chungkukjangi]|uniref:hypothetical protein n=1 Tax=Ureibacillus chungkukjangi TaxID=1202712 RepID=UPI00203DBED5|nr:hypothetical protein [Ureibacillus chungkukjangi]MCM3387287.1 hypothetical protein [Ureibacillus chungkukjangi]